MRFAGVDAGVCPRACPRYRPNGGAPDEGNNIFTTDQGVRDRFTAVQVDTYCIVRYDFEEMDWQGWTREGSPYSGLVTGLVDKDPCNHNLSTQVVFFIGSPYSSAEYPGLFDTPFCEGPGGIEPPCQDEQIVSPVIDITRYSTNCDEIQDAAIPPGILPDLGGGQLAFTVYADLPLVNLVFYRWAVRNITDGCPGPWLDRSYLYYSDEPVYRFAVEEIGDLLTSDSIQVALGIVDMCPYWYGVYGDCAEHTPAPWFDNVSIRRHATIGPQWSCRPIDLFQDNFPGGGGYRELGSCRYGRRY
jgi:hypothetical protein